MAIRTSLVQILSTTALIVAFVSCAPNDERSFRAKPNPERSLDAARAKAAADEKAKKEAADAAAKAKRERGDAAGGTGAGAAGGGGAAGGAGAAAGAGQGTAVGTPLGGGTPIQTRTQPAGRGRTQQETETTRARFDGYLQEARDREQANPGAALKVIRGLSVNVTLFNDKNTDSATCEGSVPCLSIELLAVLGIHSDPVKTISRRIVRLEDGKAPYEIFELKVFKQPAGEEEIPGASVRLLCDNEKCTDIWLVYYAQAEGKDKPEIAAYNFVPKTALVNGDYVGRVATAMKVNVETEASLAGRLRTTVGDGFKEFEQAVINMDNDEAATRLRLDEERKRAAEANKKQLSDREKIIKDLFNKAMSEAKVIAAAKVTAVIVGLSTSVRPASGARCLNAGAALEPAESQTADPGTPGFCIDVKANLVLGGKPEVALSRGVLYVKDGIPSDSEFRPFTTREMSSSEKKPIADAKVFVACLDSECKEVYVDYSVADVRGVYAFIKQSDDVDAKELKFKLENEVPVSSVGKDAKPFVAPADVSGSGGTGSGAARPASPPPPAAAAPAGAPRPAAPPVASAARPVTAVPQPPPAEPGEKRGYGMAAWCGFTWGYGSGCQGKSGGLF